MIDIVYVLFGIDAHTEDMLGIFLQKSLQKMQKNCMTNTHFIVSVKWR